MVLKVGSVYSSTVKAKVVNEIDVLVAGGGTAGCVAAIAAARNGMSVLLIERRGFLGGMMTGGNAALATYMVHNMNRADRGKILAQLATNPSSVQVVGGIPMEIAKRLIDMGAGIGTHGTAGTYVFTMQQELKELLLEMMEEAGVKLLFHSLIVDVIEDDNVVRGIVVENKSGRQAVLARILVDATGDGDVAAKAGAPFVVGVGPDDMAAKDGTPLQSMQEMGVMFRVGNVNMARCFEYLKSHPDKFHMQRFGRMKLDEAYENFLKGDGMICRITAANHNFQIQSTPISGVFTLCCPKYKGSGLSANDLTQGEIALAKEVRRRVADMKKSVPGFEKAYLLDCPEICVRETRHIEGEFVLNIEDIHLSREFKDTIGKGSHPIDIQPIPDVLDKYVLPACWSFNIPYRCLVPKKIDNLLIAGRCISTTHEASGCTRVTVPCMITGEAAGTAAAMCIKENVKPINLNTDKLRRKLTDQGVVL